MSVKLKMKSTNCLNVTALALVLAFASLPRLTSAQFFADWSVLARDRQPACVPIPSNMSLCHNVGYTKMRLPNLLDHDTMQEASQQASSWVPLLNVKCHQDTQLFLCSLFAPLCLERPIYPCRSLCQKVKSGCLSTMENHGFPWPSMLDCDKFPMDNDMCITSQSDKNGSGVGQGAPKSISASNGAGGQTRKDQDLEAKCSSRVCNQAGTYENILANFCQADFVVKMKFKDTKRRLAVGRKVNAVYKTWRGTPNELRKLRKPRLRLREADQCCTGWLSSQPNRQRYLVMGKKEGNRLIPTFIHPWKKSNEDLRRARRMFQQIDCSNLRETSQRVIAQSMASPQGASAAAYPKDSESRKRRRTLTRKSMFDFRSDSYDPTNSVVASLTNNLLSGGAGEILGNPGPIVKQRKVKRNKKRRRHRQGLRRRSRLQENWLTETEVETTSGKSAINSHENDVFSQRLAQRAREVEGETTTPPPRRRPRNRPIKDITSS